MKLTPAKTPRHRRMIAASEVGEFLFCAKAWKLKLDGHTPESPRLEAGTAFHLGHQAGVAWARRLRGLGVAAASIAMVIALLWLLIRIWR